MPLAPRSRLGHYEIDAQIGAGGMGEVYRAHDSRLNRLVAIKIPRDRFDSARDLAFALESVSSGSGREKVVKAAPSRKIAGFWLGRHGAQASVPQFQRVTFLSQW